jgi:prolyl oligopeptidase
MTTSKSFLVIFLLLAALLPACLSAQTADSAKSDPYLWLEEIESPRALEWVKGHNAATMAEFQNDSNFMRFQSEILSLLNSNDRIPSGKLRGGYVYNFWQDSVHIKGIIRRTTLNEYIKKEPSWETVLDIDKLSIDEGKDWVYLSSNPLPPDYSRTMLELSIGGKDAAYFREFDYSTKSFVPDGFYVPEAKSSVNWYDENTLIIGTDFGTGTMTTSGYPRIVKLWRRGTPLAEAKTILEGDSTDVSVYGEVYFHPEGNLFTIGQGISFWESRVWIVDSNSNKIELPFPKNSEIDGLFKGFLIVRLQSDWLNYPEGSLLAVKLASLRSRDFKFGVEPLFTPDEFSTINEVNIAKDYIIATTLKNVRSQALYYSLANSEGKEVWSKGKMNLPDMGSVSISSSNPFTDTVMISYEDFVTPTRLLLYDNPKGNPQIIKSMPDVFNTGNYKLEQLTAVSKDGTIIPYFIASAKNAVWDGSNPTLLYGYGGFRSSELPYYSRSLGKIWLANGGIYVLANIRGGGEFGPRWHKAALFENRQKSFDDFIAVGEDLIKRKICSPKHLGIEGGSNGGLLVGAVFTQRPELFNAVVCQVPLLDMIRYTKLGAGASWIGEFGDPDVPEQQTYISKYSPYQNLKSGISYPKVLFVTSTLDDRVHPGHARKMAAMMEQMGHKIYYHEEIAGGHGATADNIQLATRMALEFAYLFKMLK